MATYQLRNQWKIVEYYERMKKGAGNEVLRRMLKSLDEHFEAKRPIEATYWGADDRYETFTVNDTGHTCGEIAFYIVEQKEGWHLLAFREFVG